MLIFTSIALLPDRYLPTSLSVLALIPQKSFGQEGTSGPFISSLFYHIVKFLTHFMHTILLFPRPS